MTKTHGEMKKKTKQIGRGHVTEFKTALNDFQSKPGVADQGTTQS